MPATPKRKKAAIAWDRAADAWKRAEGLRRDVDEAEVQAKLLTAEARLAENEYLVEEAKEAADASDAEA